MSFWQPKTLAQIFPLSLYRNIVKNYQGHDLIFFNFRVPKSAKKSWRIWEWSLPWRSAWNLEVPMSRRLCFQSLVFLHPLLRENLPILTSGKKNTNYTDVCSIGSGIPTIASWVEGSRPNAGYFTVFHLCRAQVHRSEWLPAYRVRGTPPLAWGWTSTPKPFIRFVGEFLDDPSNYYQLSFLYLVSCACALIPHLYVLQCTYWYQHLQWRSEKRCEWYW